MLKLQYFGHLMQRADSLEKILMLGGIGGRRRRGLFGRDSGCDPVLTSWDLKRLCSAGWGRRRWQEGRQEDAEAALGPSERLAKYPECTLITFLSSLAGTAYFPQDA